MRQFDDEPPMTPERARAILAEKLDSWIDERVDPDRAINWWHGRHGRRRGRR